MATVQPDYTVDGSTQALVSSVYRGVLSPNAQNAQQPSDVINVWLSPPLAKALDKALKPRKGQGVTLTEIRYDRQESSSASRSRSSGGSVSSHTSGAVPSSAASHSGALGPVVVTPVVVALLESAWQEIA